MLDGDWGIAKRTMDLRVTDEHKLAAGRTLARLAREGRPGGLAWHGRWLLCELGFRLVALGAWLVGDHLPEAQTIRVQQ
jgi:hypothetical protein